MLARQQRKPALFVSPPVTFPTLKELENELRDHPQAKKLLDNLKTELPIKENENGIPSLWYMPLVGTESFFDGFGFNIEKYMREFKWTIGSDLNKRESRYPPKRPLLTYLDSIATGQFPKRWNHHSERLAENDDWLLIEQALKT